MTRRSVVIESHEERAASLPSPTTSNTAVDCGGAARVAGVAGETTTRHAQLGLRTTYIYYITYHAQLGLAAAAPAHGLGEPPCVQNRYSFVTRHVIARSRTRPRRAAVCVYIYTYDRDVRDSFVANGEENESAHAPRHR